MHNIVKAAAVLACGLFVACGTPLDPPGTHTPPSVASRAAIVKDSTGSSLGRLVSASYAQLEIVTSTGHLVSMTWAGGLTPSMLVWQTDPATAGAPVYILAGQQTGVADHAVFVGLGEALYVPKQAFGNGLASWNIAVTSYRWTIYGGAIFDYGSDVTIQPGNIVVELKEATRADVGLPATISGPLSLTFP